MDTVRCRLRPTRTPLDTDGPHPPARHLLPAAPAGRPADQYQQHRYVLAQQQAQLLHQKLRQQQFQQQQPVFLPCQHLDSGRRWSTSPCCCWVGPATWHRPRSVGWGLAPAAARTAAPASHRRRALPLPLEARPPAPPSCARSRERGQEDIEDSGTGRQSCADDQLASVAAPQSTRPRWPLPQSQWGQA